MSQDKTENIDEICKMAKKSGTSYGKYVGLKYLQQHKIRRKRKAKERCAE